MSCHPLEAALIGFHDPLIGVLREEERDIHVDPFSDEFLDGDDSFIGGRDFDHRVVARHRLPKASSLVDGPLRIVRKQR